MSALLNDEPRNASAIAADHGTEVLYIDKATFNRLLGPVRELLERREDETNELMMVEVEMLQNLPPPPTTSHHLPPPPTAPHQFPPLPIASHHHPPPLFQVGMLQNLPAITNY